MRPGKPLTKSHDFWALAIRADRQFRSSPQAVILFRFSLQKGASQKEAVGFTYDFSFSGLKTAMLRLVEKLKSDSQRMPLEDLAASFEQVVAEVLVERTLRCALDHMIPHIVMVGGVAANARLRRLMQQRPKQWSHCLDRTVGVLH